MVFVCERFPLKSFVFPLFPDPTENSRIGACIFHLPLANQKKEHKQNIKIESDEYKVDTLE